MAQGPGAVDEADVSGQTGGQDAVGQGDQPAAPLEVPVPVAVAEPLVEAEPGQQAAGCTQGQREQHPVLGRAGHEGSEGPSEQEVEPVAVSAQPSTALLPDHPSPKCAELLLMGLLAPGTFSLCENHFILLTAGFISSLLAPKPSKFLDAKE